jgi:hypothetical protein
MSNEYIALGGLRIDEENSSTRRNSVPVTFRPPQIPYELTWAVPVERWRIAA